MVTDKETGTEETQKLQEAGSVSVDAPMVNEFGLETLLTHAVVLDAMEEILRNVIKVNLTVEAIG